MSFACTHILNVFSLPFCIPVFVCYFLPSLSQLFRRGLMLSALYALIFFFFNSPHPTPPNICCCSVAYQANGFLFSSSMCRGYSISSIWDISKWKTDFKMYCTGTWWYYCSIPVPAWCGISLAVVLACWALLLLLFWKSLLHLFLFPTLSHFFFSCR